MGKYKMLFLCIFFIMFVTVVAQQMEVFAATQNIAGNLGGDLEVSTTGVLGFLKTYLNLITFKVVGFPDILNVLIFYPINIIAVYFLAEIVKDIIPFA